MRFDEKSPGLKTSGSCRSYDTDFDGQKLKYHPSEVAWWLREGVTRGPLYTEMELTTLCNHRCIFCGVDHIVNKTADQIDTSVALRVIRELDEMGNRSIMFSGHGESLLHDEAVTVIRYASGRMKTSVTTNGSLLDNDRVEVIDGLEWIRFSINGCGPESYSHVHGTTPDMFERVMENIEGAVRRKRELGLDVTIGAQMVLLKENAEGVVDLGHRVKRAGVDYFSVKPYSQHPLSINHRTVDYSRWLHLGRDLLGLEDDSFRVIFREDSMKRVGSPKGYKQCHGTHFLNFVAADGNVWECNVFAGDPRFLLGNVQRASLRELWTGERRKEVLRFIARDLDPDDCRDVCRMEACNRYLWRLKNPLAHDDFI